MSDAQQAIEWDALILSIHEGDCILMIGPDAITESFEDRDVPLMSLFSNELRRQLVDGSRYAPLSPSQVAQVFKDFQDSLSLRTVARDFFGRRRNVTVPALANLAALPFKLVIDTTPLNQMEHAFSEAGKSSTEEWYQKNGNPRTLDAAFDSTKPLVYHIFGSTNDLKSLVLAESDFVDLLVCVISGNPRLPDRLLNAFSDDSCMLFLGFGVRHPSLRILLHVISRGRTRNRSFALERFDDNVERLSAEGAKVLFQQGHRIDFVEMELGDFTLELRRRYEAYKASQVGSPQPAVRSSRAPLAFLSYCREDAAEAKRISTGLDARGIKIWMDADEIRAGQRWDPQIERVIGHEVDYFIVLNSITLANTGEGYVFKELKLALDRESRFRGSFLCPVQIDDTPLLHELDRFHCIDGRADVGLDQLAKHLKRDFEERKKTIS